VHGDHQRLRLHAGLAAEVGIPPERVFTGRNGLPLEIDRDGAEFGEEEPSGVILVDGIDLADPNDAALRDRRTISADGICIVVAAIGADDGELLSDPEVIARGIGSIEDDPELADQIADLAEDSLADSARAGVREIDLIQADLHDRVAEFIHRELRRRPLIVPVVSEV
jgi:ribonuclease J